MPSTTINVKPLKVSQAKYTTYCNLPDQLVPLGITSYFSDVLGLTNKFVNIFGKNIFTYARDDNPTVALPSMNVYVVESNKIGDMGYLNGVVRVEFNLPAFLNRSQLTEVSMSLYNMFTFLIMTNEFLDYINSIVPGMREFNWDTKLNLRDLYGTKNRTTYTFNLDINYMIDLAQYYYYLNINGLSVTDPCDQADIVNKYFLTVNTGETQNDN